MALAATLSRQLALGIAVLFLAGGCATLPPGMDAPKTASVALDAPETTGIGKVMAARAKAYPGLSGFRLLADGKDSFQLRLRIAQGAEHTLDLQYFLLQQDDTGQLLLAALLDAADRGVRVRLLLDDAQAFETGSMIRPLAAHPNIEIRIYNPFVARQGFAFLRGAELLLDANRLNYRMHNKLFIGDNAIAVTGGRNIGDEYFQASSAVEFGDFDLAAGSGHPRSGSASQFALHAKVFVIDRKRVFVGSMNFDQRSQRFNTEIGLIVDSAELAQEIATRFEAIAQPANSYQLVLEGPADGGAKSLSWVTAEGDRTLRFHADPGVDVLTRAQIRMLSLLPLDHLL